MERVVQKRLECVLEETIEGISKLAKDQAGFRRGRATIEQITRMAQYADDGFATKPANARHANARTKTVMVLVDFSRAYDRRC